MVFYDLIHVFNSTVMYPTDEEIIKAFGQTLREKRIELGMTQAELAQKADMKLEEIRGYEKGLGDPRLSTVLKVSRAFERLPSTWIRRMDEILRSGK